MGQECPSGQDVLSGDGTRRAGTVRGVVFATTTRASANASPATTAPSARSKRSSADRAPGGGPERGLAQGHFARSFRGDVDDFGAPLCAFLRRPLPQKKHKDKQFYQKKKKKKKKKKK